MLPYVIAGIIGAGLMGRTKSKSTIKKMALLGPRSGITYEAENVDGLGLYIVHAPDGSRGVFVQGEEGFTFSRGMGSPETIAAMRDDLEAEPKKEGPSVAD
jgi:hypothetical protein